MKHAGNIDEVKERSVFDTDGNVVGKTYSTDRQLIKEKLFKFTNIFQFLNGWRYKYILPFNGYGIKPTLQPSDRFCLVRATLNGGYVSFCPSQWNALFRNYEILIHNKFPFVLKFNKTPLTDEQYRQMLDFKFCEDDNNKKKIITI